jgi:hypothetical protein
MALWAFSLDRHASRTWYDADAARKALAVSRPMPELAPIEVNFFGLPTTQL